MVETVAEFAARMARLQRLACPTSEDVGEFNRSIQEASALGLNYREGLEYIIRLRNGGAD